MSKQNHFFHFASLLTCPYPGTVPDWLEKTELHAAVSSYYGSSSNSSGKIIYTHDNGINWYGSTVNNSYYLLLLYMH